MRLGLGLHKGRPLAPARPAFFSSMPLEFDAANLPSVALSGTSVTSWAATTGSGALVGSSPFPVLNSGPQRVSFANPANDDLIGNAASLTAGSALIDFYAISMLIRVNDTSADHAVLELGVAPFRRATVQFGSADKTFALIYQKSSGGAIEYIFTPINQIPVTPAWRLITFSLDFNAGEGDSWTNRTQVTNGAAPVGSAAAASFNQIRLGGPGFGDMAFDIAWVGLFDTHLTTAQVGEIATYLQHRFGVPI